ncbi:hypothetical protein J4T94_gp078 [Mycobacterium phage Krypton555]|uniref:Uncharacterized protein n=1 Tax=Mycobacterium phage Krypton555 TaxID=2015885 RepID=A0A222ZRJ4_9CAUD|nr:hypothetical protein J4T94_gp078 [Mycobacterium phage Krypton555]ASR87138.1 hypothetical protein KRYPTON555_104 [Mycobacterium phage Krypton555]
MPSAFKPYDRWGPLPTVNQVEAIYQAVGYSYEAGDFPDDMDPYTEAFVVGDGGLLNALSALKRALCLLDVQAAERRRGQAG